MFYAELWRQTVSIVVPVMPLELHPQQPAEPTEGKPKRIPLSPTQVVLLVAAILPTAGAVLWPTMDLAYQGYWDHSPIWSACVMTACAAWATFACRSGQESIMRRQDRLDARLDAWLTAVHAYHSDLGDKLDRYGDAREVNGHHIAAEALRGHVPHLRSVD